MPGRHTIEKDIPDGADFPIGEVIQIDLDGKRYISIMRGVVAGDCIIADAPVRYGKRVVFNYNAVFKVYFLWSGRLVNFRSAILDIFPALNLMLIEFPKQVESISLRKSKRLKVVTPVELSREQEKMSGAMIDISSSGGGCAFDKSVAPEEDTGYLASFYLPDGVKVENIPVVTRNLREVGEKIHIGISFSDAEHAGFESIKGYCNEGHRYERF